MAQNNSAFVWKTSNYSRGRSNLRNDMNQVKNLKSLGFTWKSFWGCFMRHKLPGFPWCCFWSPYFFNRSICGRPWKKLLKIIICIRCWSSWFNSTNPKKLPAFTSPLSTSCTGEQSSYFLRNRWLLVFIHQPFCHIAKPINNCTISFGAFWLLMIQE